MSPGSGRLATHASPAPWPSWRRRTSLDLDVKPADLARALAGRHTEVDLPVAGR